MIHVPINLERLFKLRLVVARYGEMDIAKWWNTRGQLGRLGSSALRRGFPRTHYFAQARAVFAVADHRCTEVFDPPNSVTLWRLPESIEAEFETRWELWLDHVEDWRPFFQTIEALSAADLDVTLRELKLVSDSELAALSRLRRSAEGRAVPLYAPFAATDANVALLALGFSLGEVGALTVPYARLGDE